MRKLGVLDVGVIVKPDGLDLVIRHPDNGHFGTAGFENDGVADLKVWVVELVHELGDGHQQPFLPPFLPPVGLGMGLEPLAIVADPCAGGKCAGRRIGRHE